MQSYLDEQMSFSEHFSEFYKIIRFSAIGVVIISIFLSFFIDDILINWLDNLSLKNDFSLAIYSPYDWIDTKWALLLIFSITLILPYSSLKMRKFALPGLYPRERKWFTSVIFLQALLYLFYYT